MSASNVFLIAFIAVVGVILLGIWAAFVFEANGHSPGREQAAAGPSEEPGETAEPERRAA
jgi:hypothetical protein